MSEVVGSIPEFTVDESTEGVEEVKQPIVEEMVEEKETPELPAEKPVTTSDENTEQPDSQEVLNKAVERATGGLRNEIVELRKELAVAKGNDRKLIQQEIIQKTEKIDELADVNPADAALIEKVLKAKGYISKDEVQAMGRETVKTTLLNNFLNKYPEFKPENDPGDKNWNALTAEYGLYAEPKDPLMVEKLLEKARLAVTPQVASDPIIPVKKRSLQTASVGAGGVQRSSSSKVLSQEMRRQYEDGGWTEEEIIAIEKSL